ncbi:50S ribosomal protein l2-b chloroplastic, partial [Phtheirospermum japonicum]
QGSYPTNAWVRLYPNFSDLPQHSPLVRLLVSSFWIKRTSPEGSFNVTDFSSFAISFATAPAALTNCPPFLRVISMLYMVVPKDTSFEVDSFFLSVKTPS